MKLDAKKDLSADRTLERERIKHYLKSDRERPGHFRPYLMLIVHVFSPLFMAYEIHPKFAQDKITSYQPKHHTKQSVIALVLRGTGSSICIFVVAIVEHHAN